MPTPAPAPAPTPHASAPLDLIATCAFGLEAVVVRELAALNLPAEVISTGRVLFKGDARDIARANIHLRTADRVLVRVLHFHAPDFDRLFDTVRAHDWTPWIGPNDAFPVNGRSVKSQLSSVPAVQRTVKKALAESLLAAHAVPALPESGPRVLLEAALLNDHASITIDTSGDGLHKRGYRTLVGDAAMKETLAAGLVLLSPWNRARPLIDPFCGTGTIAIEAALLARNIAPGLHRPFDAERWPAVGPAVFAEARELARAAQLPPLELKIHASDTDERALSMARRHADAAGVLGDIHFTRRAFADLATKRDYGCIITNPPYGQRLGESEDIEALYARFPIILRNLPTWSFFIITARQDFESILGQPATRRRKLFNAQLECTYYQFLGPKPPGLTRSSNAAAPPAPATPDTNDPTDDPTSDIAADTADNPTDAPDPAEPPTHARPPRPQAAPIAPVFGGLRDRDLREIEQFRATLANNARHLRRYPTKFGITCYRVYERDAPDVPLIIDRYEDRAHVFEYERDHSRTPAQQADWTERCAAVIAEVLDIRPEHVVMKMRERQKGLSQHEKLDESGETFEAREGGLRFLVNLRDFTDTGLFLDHRLTRAMVKDRADGARVLNLFCYTGSFSVYAAAGGARATTSVDLSNTYLDWTRRNLELNGFRSTRDTLHRCVKSDVGEFLASHPPGAHYDLAVVDPPTFSNSKSTDGDWDVQRDHAALLHRVADLMAPGGVIYFSNNFRRFKLDEAALSRLRVREISARTIPPEYRNRRIHRCWTLEVPGGHPHPSNPDPSNPDTADA